MRCLTFANTLLVASFLSLRADSTVLAETSPSRVDTVAIVELFTSEGCSSCPPADTILKQIHLKRSSAGQLIIGLSEHVTYWNHLGWRDPYSDEVFTDRQNRYALRLSPEGPYTPQMIVNGREQFVGSNSAALQEALRADTNRKHVSLEITTLVPHADALELTFAVTGTGSKPLDIIAVLTDDIDKSTVSRGENSGRSLQHVSVARTLSRVASVNGDGERSAHLVLPESFRHGSGAGHHLVLFAQEQHQGSILGAAMIPI